jgi:hypothetical protein
MRLERNSKMTAERFYQYLAEYPNQVPTYHPTHLQQWPRQKRLSTKR